MIFVQIWFFQRLKLYSIRHWALEQKWMAVLLPLLLLYDSEKFQIVLSVEKRFMIF